MDPTCSLLLCFQDEIYLFGTSYVRSLFFQKGFDDLHGLLIMLTILHLPRTRLGPFADSFAGGAPILTTSLGIIKFMPANISQRRRYAVRLSHIVYDVPPISVSCAGTGTSGVTSSACFSSATGCSPLTIVGAGTASASTGAAMSLVPLTSLCVSCSAVGAGVSKL